MLRRVLTLLLTLALCLAPAAAWADGGAGDNQYQDPLAAPTTPKKAKKKPTTPATGAPAAATAPAAAASPAPVSSTSAASTTTAAASPRQLPRTGEPADLFALLGAALIASGALLRRRTSAQ